MVLEGNLESIEACNDFVLKERPYMFSPPERATGSFEIISSKDQVSSNSPLSNSKSYAHEVTHGHISALTTSL
jgi:hypothetical protein